MHGKFDSAPHKASDGARAHFRVSRDGMTWASPIGEDACLNRTLKEDRRGHCTGMSESRWSRGHRHLPDVFDEVLHRLSRRGRHGALLRGLREGCPWSGIQAGHCIGGARPAGAVCSDSRRHRGFLRAQEHAGGSAGAEPRCRCEVGQDWSWPRGCWGPPLVRRLVHSELSWARTLQRVTTSAARSATEQVPCYQPRTVTLTSMDVPTQRLRASASRTTAWGFTVSTQSRSNTTPS